MSRREKIDTDRARRLYDRLGTWPAVARVMRRKDETRFQTQSIMRAVRFDDRAPLSSQGRGGAPSHQRSQGE